MKKFALVIAILLLPVIAGSVFVEAQSQRTVTFKATINPGSLITDVRDRFGSSILAPVLNLGKVVNSVSCRVDEGALSGTLGNDNQRIYVDNPKAAFDGWTLTLQTLESSESKWVGESGNSFDVNDSGGDGCLDSDNDGVAGELAINPAEAKINSDCLECSLESLSVGSAHEQSFGTNNSITLLRAGDDSDELGSWYMTDVGVRQSIPAGQDGDVYSLEMVLTAVAN